MHRSEYNPGGFSLLEVIVTLAVLSISLTVLFRIFSSVTLTSGLTSDYYQALKIAETRMSLLSAKAGSSIGGSGTVDDYYQWKSKVERYTPAYDSPLANSQSSLDTDSATRPYLLTVSVSWGTNKKRELELTTVRLGMQP
jgi:prepilin-type N-terminal cleavage/methylation domain-containing protein